VKSVPDHDSGIGTLSREAIIPAALALMDAEGVDGLSMRKLAGRLGVSAQALYWHFSSKDDLCQAVVDSVRQSFRLDENPTLLAVDRLRALLYGLREHWSLHPSAAVLGLRFFPSEAGRVSEFGIALLESMGFDEEEALLHYRAALWTVLGFSHVEQAATKSVHHFPVDAERGIYEVRLSHPTSAGEDVPVKVSILDVNELFDTVVDLFLRGLTAKKRSTKAARTRSRTSA
jgi:AcrR family transcriptional regulator